MEAVIDPSGPTIVGFVPPNACRNGGAWENFITLPLPQNMDQETLGVETDGKGGYTFIIDPAKIAAKTEEAIILNKAFRKICLKETDFTMLPDTGLTNIDEWKEFRATLRNLDMTPPVSWPTEPSSPWKPFLPTPPQQ